MLTITPDLALIVIGHRASQFSAVSSINRIRLRRNVVALGERT
jgi:hypothetical protein